MKNGARPTLTHHQPKQSFERKFGSLSLQDIPEFNLDKGLWLPDQDADSAFTECTGYAAADIATDLFGRVMSPDFAYAANLYVSGDPPGISGASVTGALWGLIAFGALPQVFAPLQAAVQGELYISDFTNWSKDSRSYAKQYVQNGIYSALGRSDDAFSSVLSTAYMGKIGISVGTPWYKEWGDAITGNGMSPTAVMPVPKDAVGQAQDQRTPWHNWTVKGAKTINGQLMWLAKSWIPKSKGDNGWLYIPQESANVALSVPGAAAVTIDPSEARRIVILAIMAQRFPYLVFDPVRMWQIYQTLSL